MGKQPRYSRISVTMGCHFRIRELRLPAQQITRSTPQTGTEATDVPSHHLARTPSAGFDGNRRVLVISTPQGYERETLHFSWVQCKHPSCDQWFPIVDFQGTSRGSSLPVVFRPSTKLCKCQDWHNAFTLRWLIRYNAPLLRKLRHGRPVRRFHSCHT